MAGTSAGTRRSSPDRATSSSCVNYHGSSGFGQKFLETITARYGEKELADTEAATDFLLKQGYIDRERLVATGGSYGGFMVAFMNGHTDRYQGLRLPRRLLRLGQHDGRPTRTSSSPKELGAFHWDDEPQVMRQSPHHYVKNAKTPTLVIHGELDYRVPGDAGAAVLQLAQGQGRAGAPGLFPRREPLDPEAAELAALVPRVLRVAGAHAGAAQQKRGPVRGARVRTAACVERYPAGAPLRRAAASRCSWQAMQRVAVG